MEPHILNTVERIKEEQSEYILSIQDSTFLNYTAHKAKTEIGRIGNQGNSKNADQYGLIQHNTLCVTEKNEPLGLIDLQFCDHDTFDAEEVEKEEITILDRWIKASKLRRERLKGIDKKIVTIADREGDFFEFLHDLHVHDEWFVVRAKHNRYTGENHRRREKKLFTLLEEEQEAGKINIEINDVTTREIKEIELSVRYLKDVLLPPSNRLTKGETDRFKPIKTNAIMVHNETYRWILLTNLPTNNLSEALHVIQMYKCRWHVEDFHKILKTAYQVEKLYLHASREAIENALTMASISACRFYWMVYVGRVESDCTADRVFQEYEWKTLYIYFKEPIPKKAPLLADVIRKIALLGGYKHNKKAKPPGIKTMWIGF
jgi:hypothetical protein